MMENKKQYKPRFFEYRTIQVALTDQRKEWEVRREIQKKARQHPTIVVLPKDNTKQMEYLLARIIQVIQQRHPSYYPVRIAPYTNFAPIKEGKRG